MEAHIRRSVLVTGATGGLGSAIATLLSARGDALTLVGRSHATLAALSVPGHKVALDLCHDQACEKAVAAAVEAYGGLDVVVNAAGVVAFGPVEELTVETMEQLFRTNTFAPIMLARAALPVMRENGVFLNITGVVAEQNFPGLAAYGASKAAARSFNEAFAREARRKKVRVVDARPPHTETGLANRPIAGQAPKMRPGLAPSFVAQVICDAIDGDATDLSAAAFGAG